MGLEIRLKSINVHEIQEVNITHKKVQTPFALKASYGSP